ncbi:FAD-dependent oxidoreductase [Agromyces aerolatus]|uniref:FAD-dependent oxidoreductase n=1 Tax=Agromyces sp. LY-1074 TaxID=3074080 RepID=UPI002855A187|nr:MULTISPECIES: FAD-dependent oxidoreductase [unclassified Agromyces]MDR5700516.1 FAD-dependent oxidoreductase [Agromyces sp. LY-1074]MDR5707037.1 FAD-dependent oxidoreductase [Agromyces sp. LY-1358]
MRIRSKGFGESPETVQLSWDGEPVEAQCGDTVASALIAAGQPACRDAGPDDSRGIFCGMGVCHECAVQVEGAGERLACVTPVVPGMRVSPAAPKLNLADAEPSATLPEITLSPDLLVIGGGPAGLAAAATAAEQGLSVVVLDERGKLGGQYYKQPSPAFTVDESQIDTQYRSGRALIARATKAGVQVLHGARLWGAASADRLFAANAEERWEIFPKRLVLAAGAYERGVPFPGWTLPGVMTTGAAQTLSRSYQVSPGERVLVAGNGPLNMQVAAELASAGAEVVALVELGHPVSFRSVLRGPVMAVSAPSLILDAARYTMALLRAKVPVLTGSAVVHAEGGPAGVRSVRIAKIDADGRAVAGTERDFAVDAVCLGYGFLPSNELSRLLGCRHRWDEQLKSLVVDADEAGQTSVAGVRVIGDSARVSGARVAQAAGVLAGAAVVAELTGSTPSGLRSAISKAERRLARNLRFQRAANFAYAAPVLTDQLAEPSTIVCRCERVALSQIADQTDELATTPGAVKRVSRAGMGKCQGRYCGPVMLERSARLREETVAERSGFAPQAPVKPTPISVIAAPD